MDSEKICMHRNQSTRPPSPINIHNNATCVRTCASLSQWWNRLKAGQIFVTIENVSNYRPFLQIYSQLPCHWHDFLVRDNKRHFAIGQTGKYINAHNVCMMMDMKNGKSINFSESDFGLLKKKLIIGLAVSRPDPIIGTSKVEYCGFQV